MPIVSQASLKFRFFNSEMAESGHGRNARNDDTGTQSSSNPDRRGYLRMLHQLQETLTLENIAKIAYLADLGKSLRSEIQSSSSCAVRFQKLQDGLEERDGLSESNTWPLQELLEELRLLDAVDIVKQYSGTGTDFIPSSPETSDDDYDGEVVSGGSTCDRFRELLQRVGLCGRLDNKLTLRDASIVRDVAAGGDSDLPFLFLNKLSSLDYRALLPETYSGRIDSIRDFLYALLKCSDNFLAQYIFEKLSVCQLAVPILLPSLDSESAPTFMIWALRRVIKEWRTSDSDVFLEKRMNKWPSFTVAFLRVGDLPLSKSQVINNMLGRVQGNTYHAYFLSRKEDNRSDALFSKGTVEAMWVLPSGEEKSRPRRVVSLLNFRGDISEFRTQEDFICQLANVVIVMVAKDSKEKMREVLRRMHHPSRKTVFVSLKCTEETKRTQPKFRDGWLFCKVKEGDDGMDLSMDLWERIMGFSDRISPDLYQGIEDFDGKVRGVLQLDHDTKTCSRARGIAEEILSEDIADLVGFKQRNLPLQNIFRDWVVYDKQRLVSDDFAEIQLEEIRQKKQKTREQQMKLGLSQKLDLFWTHLERIVGEYHECKYFLAYFQESVNELAVSSITPHLANMCSLEKELKALEVSSRPKKKNQKRGKSAKKRDEVSLRESITKESHSYSSKYIGFEHFIRELGQLYEAYVNGSKQCPTHVPRIGMLPQIAAQMLLEGHPFEVLDGDNGYVPIKWVVHVLRCLSKELGKPRIFVASVIGIQSSGKSTLLNAMFGVRLPVRAGRCTRGLFMQMVKVEETFARKLGYSYLIIVDTEGLRSPDRALLDEYNFDNALATLAMCLGDLTILNVQGEVMSPDMTGILQIVMHALIRMKKVDLVSHCLIVQQRISEKTAGDRNKSNMNKIIEMLDKATITAAAEEDVADHYTKFSDVFPFVPESDLHFIPCLWVGHMCPPNHFYSDAVIKLKEVILRSLSGKPKRDIAHLTMDRLISRLEDVWKAIKEEDFVFNFQNSSRALSYNKFRLHLNRWLSQSLRQRILEWEVRDFCTYAGMEDSEMIKMKAELESELQDGTKQVKTMITKYIDDHQNEEELIKHKASFEHEVNHVATDIRLGITEKLERVGKENVSVREALEKCRMELRQMARNTATALRKSKAKEKPKSKDGATIAKRELDAAFKKNWNEWIKGIEGYAAHVKTPKEEIMRSCETSLIDISKGTAINKEVVALITRKDGGITYNATKLDIKECFEGRTSDIERRRVEDFVNKITKDSLKRIRKESHDRPFDENLVKTCLGRALDDLTRTEKGSVRVPKGVISRCLRCICCNVASIIIANQHAHSDLIIGEEEQLRQEFHAFVDDSLQIEIASTRAFDCFIHSFKEIVIDDVNLKIIGDMRGQNRFIDKERLISAILVDLGTQGDYKEYIDFVRDQEDYIGRWLARYVIREYSDQHGMFFKMASEKFQDLFRCVKDICQKLFPASDVSGPLDGWLDQFREEFKTAHEYNLVSLIGLKSLDVSINYDEFTTKLLTLLEGAIGSGHLSESIQLPRTGDEVEVKAFLSRMKRNPSVELMKPFNACKAKCPFCKVVCHLHGSEHKNHTAILHYPQGLAGCKFTENKSLVLDMCTTSVASDNQYRFGEREEHRPFKEYKKDFPDWSIPPIKDSEPTTYWKWVMARFNREFAAYWGLEPASIPREWNRIGKKVALDSLKETYMAT